MSVEMENSSSLSEVELETLRSIYVDELEVDCSVNSSSVALWLHPATADKLDEQYVRIYLKFNIPKLYPEVIPEILICNSRGLSDEQIDRILRKLHAVAEARVGSSMLFELIEAAKEQLTEENTPGEECAICLYGFHDGDVFIKTECYHYFHSHCLSRYMKSIKEAHEDISEPSTSKKEESDLIPLCPVCRLPISFVPDFNEYPEPIYVTKAVIAIPDCHNKKKQELKQVYEKQVAKGGIIDLEAEKNKFLLEIANVPSKLNQISDILISVKEMTLVSPSSNQGESNFVEPLSTDAAKVSSSPSRTNDEPYRRSGGHYKTNRGGWRHDPNYGQRQSKPYQQPNIKSNKNVHENEVISSEDKEKPSNVENDDGVEVCQDDTKSSRPGFNRYNNRPRSYNKPRVPRRFNNQNHHQQLNDKKYLEDPDSPSHVTRSKDQGKERHIRSKMNDQQQVVNKPDQEHVSNNSPNQHFNKKQGFMKRVENQWDHNHSNRYNGQYNQNRNSHYNKQHIYDSRKPPYKNGISSQASVATQHNEVNSTGSNHLNYNPRPSRSSQERYSNGRGWNLYGGFSFPKSSNSKYQRNMDDINEKGNQGTKNTLNSSRDSPKHDDKLSSEFSQCKYKTDVSRQDDKVPDFNEKSLGSNISLLKPPPGFANPSKKVVYGLPSVNPPPGFHSS